MSKKVMKEPVAKKEKATGKRNRRVAAGLSVAMLVSPLSSVMAAESPKAEGSLDIDVSTSWLGDIGKKAELNLLANGVEVADVTLTPDTGWDYTFKNVPRVVEGTGEPVVYTVTEDNTDGYDTQISGDPAQGFIVTNLQADNEEVVVDDGAFDGRVTVQYRNQDGNSITHMDVFYGKTGVAYDIKPKTFPGHKLVNTEGDTTGKYVAAVSSKVVFTYEFDPEYSPEDPADEFIEGIIEARYVNQDGAEIAVRTISNGEVGEAYEVNSKEIQGYTFDRIEGLDDGEELLFEEGSQVVTYVYSENKNDESPVLGTVVTKHVNEQGEEIAERDRVSGELDGAYETVGKEIVGYDFVKINGLDSGKFSAGITIIEYVYKESVDVVTPVPPVVEDEPVVTPVPPVIDDKPVVTPVPPVIDDKPVVTPVPPVVDEKPVVTPVPPVVDGKPVVTPVVDEKPVVAPDTDDSKFAALYDKLEFGISYEEAVSIIGSDGTVISSMKDERISFDRISYEWTDEDGNWLHLTFDSGRMHSKSVSDGDVSLSETVDLEKPNASNPINDGVETPAVTDGKGNVKDDVKAADSKYKEFFDLLKHGMSYKEAVAIIGSEGEMTGSDGKAVMDLDIPRDVVLYSWKADNGDTMTLGFYKDKLITKSLIVDGVAYSDHAEGDALVALATDDTTTNAAKNMSAEDSPVAGNADESVEGKKLADTATNTANLIAIGAGLLLAAGAGLFFVNRRRQATDVE